MFFSTKKIKTNPYEFVRMERWCNPDSEIEGYVGYCKDGSIFLTWDVRIVPIFSDSCKVGYETLTLEDFNLFREVFPTIENRWIEELNRCSYEIIGIKEQYEFKLERVPKFNYYLYGEAAPR